MSGKKGISNPKYAREMHELRSSNASGTHKDKRTKRVRTRSTSRKAAIRFSSDGRFSVSCMGLPEVGAHVYLDYRQSDSDTADCLPLPT